MKKAPKDIIQKIKKKAASQAKANYTFRLTNEVVDKFRARCDQNDVSMTAVLEELLRDFLGD